MRSAYTGGSHRPSTMPTHHPSNALYHGDARDARHALTLMIGQYRYEAALAGGPRPDDGFDLDEMMTEAADKAARMLAEYDETPEPERLTLYARWATSGDSDLREWSAALSAGDYHRLAV